MTVPVPFETHAPAPRALKVKGAWPPLEDKAAGRASNDPAPSDPAVGTAMAELARAFEVFKETNDTRLSSIEGLAPGDVPTEEKLARIDAALDTARTRLDRLTLDGRHPPWARAGRRPATGPASSTRRPSTSMSGPARAAASSGSKKRPSRPAPDRMTATFCRPRSSAWC